MSQTKVSKKETTFVPNEKSSDRIQIYTVKRLMRNCTVEESPEGSLAASYTGVRVMKRNGAELMGLAPQCIDRRSVLSSPFRRPKTRYILQ